MRVALISDLHGNEIALAATLASIERVGVDQIVCLGDVATLGPRPSFVLETLRRLGCACILGNHDAFLLDVELIRQYTEAPVIVEAVDWCRAGLTADELAFVRTFRPTLELPLGAQGKLLLFHGSPRSHMQDIVATTTPDELDQLLDGHVATVMAGGHTHVQMLRQHRGTILVNPGSVGMPFRDYVGGRAPTILAHAEYAIVEADDHGVGVRLVRVPLDRAALRRSVDVAGFPLAAALREQYA